MKKNILILSLLLLICSFPINTFGECIKGDCKNGKGAFIFPDGSKFVGQYKDGKYDGQGTYTYPDGSQFVGQYKNGKPKWTKN